MPVRPPFCMPAAYMVLSPLPFFFRINHLRYSGFSFYVMPVNFVIHAPHPKSMAKTTWEKTGGGKQVLLQPCTGYRGRLTKRSVVGVEKGAGGGYGEGGGSGGPACTQAEEDVGPLV